jgi:hypothetical protein
VKARPQGRVAHQVQAIPFIKNQEH